MTDLKTIHANAKEIRDKLCLLTYPLAIKMVKNEEEIPKDAIRPFRDKGYHLDNCQAFSMSRRGQEMIAMTKEDMWCMAPFTLASIFVLLLVTYLPFITTFLPSIFSS